MSKVITIDAGNTNVDVAIWEEGNLKEFKKFSYEEFEKVNFPQYPAVGVSVKPSANELLKEKFENLKFLKIEEIPIKVDYKTPQTLGVDRVALAYAVKELYSKDAIIVSCGTAIFVDILIDGTFKGGFITLGLSKKLECLLNSAEGIKNLKLEEVEVDVGRSTKECVLGGILKESKEFIKNTILEWKEKFKKNFKVIITGGEGKFFKELGIYDELILHKGLRKLI